jgi:hypothetical protein
MNKKDFEDHDSFSKPRVLILVLSAGKEPWESIETLGQKQTCFKKDSSSTQVLWLKGSDKKSNLVEFFFNSIFQLSYDYYHYGRMPGRKIIARVRRRNLSTRNYPGLLSKYFSRYSTRYLTNNQTDQKARIINTAVPSKQALVGMKVLLGLRHVIENYEFDYLFRTNSSSYVSIESLEKFASKLPSKKVFYGPEATLGKIKFRSGSGYLLSKDVVQGVLDNHTSWEHCVPEDVAISRVIELRNLAIQKTTTRIDILDVKDSQKISPALEQDIFHFRCKSSYPEVSIDLMKKIYSASSRRRKSSI